VSACCSRRKPAGFSVPSTWSRTDTVGPQRALSRRGAGGDRPAPGGRARPRPARLASIPGTVFFLRGTTSTRGMCTSAPSGSSMKIGVKGGRRLPAQPSTRTWKSFPNVLGRRTRASRFARQWIQSSARATCSAIAPGAGRIAQRIQPLQDAALHFLQIWIIPEVRGIEAPSTNSAHVSAARKALAGCAWVARPDGRY